MNKEWAEAATLHRMLWKWWPWTMQRWQHANWNTEKNSLQHKNEIQYCIVASCCTLQSIMNLISTVLCATYNQPKSIKPLKL
jgi:hypothetical protein